MKKLFLFGLVSFYFFYFVGCKNTQPSAAIKADDGPGATGPEQSLSPKVDSVKCMAACFTSSEIQLMQCFSVIKVFNDAGEPQAVCKPSDEKNPSRYFYSVYAEPNKTADELCKIKVKIGCDGWPSRASAPDQGSWEFKLGSEDKSKDNPDARKFSEYGFDHASDGSFSVILYPLAKAGEGSEPLQKMVTGIMRAGQVSVYQ